VHVLAGGPDGRVRLGEPGVQQVLEVLVGPQLEPLEAVVEAQPRGVVGGGAEGDDDVFVPGSVERLVGGHGGRPSR
jgi:hypothetical protein